LRKLGKNEDAIQAYDELLRCKPNDIFAWEDRGIALDSLQRYEEALASFVKALTITPDYYAYKWHGILLHKLSRYEEAVDSFKQAIELQPPDNDYQDIYYSWKWLGSTLNKLGNYQQAILSLDKALENPPKNQDHRDLYYAYYHRGYALSQLGNYQDAIVSYQKALKIQPKQGEAWYNKASCYALQGNSKFALDNLKQAINLSPGKYKEMLKNDRNFNLIRNSLESVDWLINED
jgi:tetratricopeptide (TPR) repeat protein